MRGRTIPKSGLSKPSATYTHYYSVPYLSWRKCSLHLLSASLFLLPSSSKKPTGDTCAYYAGSLLTAQPNSTTPTLHPTTLLVYLHNSRHCVKIIPDQICFAGLAIKGRGILINCF